MHANHLEWPFLEPRHRTLAGELERWAARVLCQHHPHDDSVKAVDDACRKMVRELGEGGWLKYAIGGTAYGASGDAIDTRAVCLIRETLARYSGLADFSFAMQGLGSGALADPGAVLLGHTVRPRSRRRLCPAEKDVPCQIQAGCKGGRGRLTVSASSPSCRGIRQVGQHPSSPDTFRR